MAELDPVGDSQELHGNGAETNTGTLAKIESHLPAMPTAAWQYGPPQRPEILSAKPNPVELMHAVRRRLPLALGLGIAVSITAALLIWFLVPVKYEAFALVRVSEKRGGVLDKTSEAAQAFTIFKRTQVQLMSSGPVLRNTVREPTIARLPMIQEHDDDPAAWLRDQMIINYPDDAELMRVAVRGERPADVIKVVNTIVDTYLVEVVEKERLRSLDQEAALQKTYDAYAERFRQETEQLYALEQTRQAATTQAAQAAVRMAEQRLSNALVQRNNILRDIHQTEIDKTLLEARIAEPDHSKIPEALVELELRRDPVISALTNQKANIHATLARHMTVTRNPAESSHVQQLNAMIHRIEQQIDEYSASMRPHIMEMLAAEDMNDNNPVADGAMTVAMLDSKKDHLEDALIKAEALIDDEVKRFEALRQQSGDVTAKREELKSLNQIMQKIKAEIDQTGVERLAASRITKYDEAQLDSPRGDAIRKYVAVAFAAILGFGVVVVGIAFYEFQARKLNDTQQVKEGLGIKVVGELPSVTGRTWRRIRGGRGPAVLKALMAERIDGTRTALIHASAAEPPRVVMVTSADPHEGKTTTSSQLAASLARAGRRTLLIDADIRNPGVHRVFDMPLEPGLSELLRGEAERDSVVHPTRTANLWLLPAGRCDLRSVQALSTSYLGTAIAGLCVQFDYVVIDSGPILKVADSLLIGQHVDAAILSVLKDRSKVANVYEASERLSSVGITVLGAVVNGVNDDAARHGIELLMSESEANEATEQTT